MFKIFIILLSIIVFSQSKRFTLPGDQLWPNTDDITKFRELVTGETLTPSDERYSVINNQTYNWRTGPPLPLIIVIAENIEDINTTLTFAKKHVLRLSIRSTGHHQDIRNTADNCILLDMRKFNQKKIDKDSKVITVGPGQTWAEIQEYIDNESGGTLVAGSGAEPSVGPAGWALGGGHGRLTRLYGLGADLLESVDILLANGSLVTANSTCYPDLFQSLRGAGANGFGIVTSLTFRIFDDPGSVATFTGVYLPSDDVADGFQNWMKSTPDCSGGYYILNFSPVTNQMIVIIGAYCIGDSDTCDTILAPLVNIPNCVVGAIPDVCSIKHDYTSLQDYLNATKDTVDVGGNNIAIYLVSAALDFSDAGELRVPTNWAKSFNPTDWPDAVIGCSGNAVLGGQSADMDPDQTLTSVAPAMRKALMAITCYVGWNSSILMSRPDLVTKIDQWADTELKTLSVDEWVYWNEPQHNFADNDWQRRYWGSDDVYKRLKATKQIYDPENVFTCYHCVGWEDVENMDPAVCPGQCTCTNILVEETCAQLPSFNNVTLPITPPPPHNPPHNPPSKCCCSKKKKTYDRK